MQNHSVINKQHGCKNHCRVLPANISSDKIFQIPPNMYLASVIQIESEDQDKKLISDLTLNVNEGEAVPADLTFDRPKGLIHGHGPLDNQSARFVHANVKFQKKRYPLKERKIS